MASSLDRIIAESLLSSGGGSQRHSVASAIASMEASDVLVTHRAKSSVFCERLLLLVGWGVVSANVAQWLCSGLKEDAFENEEICKIASWGSHGKYPGNVRRDMMRQYCPASANVPRPLPIQVHIYDRLKVVHEASQYILNPLDVASYLYTDHRPMFQKLFLETSPRSFWDQVDPGDPRWIRLAELRNRPHWKDKCIPVMIHADGATFVNKSSNSLACAQWKSMLTGNFNEYSIFPLFSIPKDVVVKDLGTMDRIWQELVHLFNHGYNGLHPTVDSLGNPWPRGSRTASLGGKRFLNDEYWFVFWGGAADLEWMGNDYKFPHFNSLEPCWFCRASRRPGSPYPIIEVGPEAKWRSSVYSFAEGCAIQPSTHPIMGLIGASRYHFMGDLMHTGALGVCSYFAGSVLHELVNDDRICAGGSRSERLDYIWSRIQHFYSLYDIPSRFTYLPMNVFMASDGGFPRLKGKAADIQWLLVPIHEILLELDDGSSHHRHRIRACKSLCDLFAIVRKNDSFLSEGDAKELEDSIELFLVHNNWLLERSLEESNLLYCHSTKAHMLSHIGELAKYQSPRAFWTYTWESFIGHVVQSAKSCLAGTPMQGVGKKILENFMLVLQIIATREQPERP